MWEIRVDRADRIPPRKGSDQWIARPDSVRIEAMWIHGCNADNLPMEYQVTITEWDPILEANPTGIHWGNPQRDAELVDRTISEQRIARDRNTHIGMMQPLQAPPATVQQCQQLVQLAAVSFLRGGTQL